MLGSGRKGFPGCNALNFPHRVGEF
ncbi:hypothetical protein [uncultured Sphaerochaeta sp.]